MELLGILLSPVFGLIGVLVGAGISTKLQERLASLERSHALRMAALEKRLSVHQRAYSLWNKVMGQIHKDGLPNAINECQDFWNENCLYLAPESRMKFKEFYITAHLYPELYRGTPEAKRVWNELSDTGRVLAEGVALPSIGELEVKLVGNGDSVVDRDA